MPTRKKGDDLGIAYGYMIWYNRYNHTLQRGIMKIDFGKCLWLGLPHYSKYVVSSVPHFRVLRCLCKDRHGGTLAPGMNKGRPNRGPVATTVSGVVDQCWCPEKGRLYRMEVLRGLWDHKFGRSQNWCLCQKQTDFVKPLRPALKRFLLVMGFVSLVLTCCICPNKQNRQDVGRTHNCHASTWL